MKLMKRFVHLLYNASKTQACGLTVIGVGMLALTDVLDTVENAVLRELAHAAVIVGGFVGTVLLFPPPDSGTRSK